MFYLFISAFFLLPVFAGWGSFFANLTGTLEKGISGKIFLGILVITVCWSLLAIFLPLNIYVEIITVAAGIFLFFFQKNYEDLWQFFKANWFCFVLLVLLCAFFGSFSPFILDHFGYYVPTVKWLSEFGLVKGISNLDLILGQMSFWHVLQAGFSNFSDPFLRLNSILIMAYAVYIFERKAWIHLIFLPFFFLFSQQPSPDLPVYLFSLIVLNEVLLGNKNQGLLMLFSAFVFVVKPTALWLPLLVFLYCIIILKPNFKAWIPAFFVLSLFVFKNIWTFGFPVYPVHMVDVRVSWKPSPELLKNSAQLAIEKTYDMQYSYQQIQKFTAADYIKNWLLLDGIKGKINILFLLTLFSFGIFTVFRMRKVVSIIFISLLVKSVLVLLFSAQYRFFLDVFFAEAFVMLFLKMDKLKSVASFSLFTLAIGTVMVFPEIIQRFVPSFNLGFAMAGFQKEQIYKPAEYSYKKFKTYSIGNLKFNVVKDYPFSFDTPLPAVSPGFLLEYYNAGIFPQRNSNNLKDGFHWKKISSLEKQQLKKILEDLKINP